MSTGSSINSVEAGRVLAVLDESLEETRLLSFVTGEVLESAEHLRDALGEDLVNRLIKHRHVIHLHGKSSQCSDPVMASTLELVRLLKRSPLEATRLQNIHTERSPAIFQVIAYLTKLRHFAQKRLATSVEEDNSNREYFEEVKEREERAVSEKIQLDQKLKLQRVELQKQVNQIQNSEDKTRAELHELQINTQAHRQAIQQGASAVRHEDFKTFDTEKQLLENELRMEKARLATLREEHKVAEASLSKIKKRAAQDVESVINEYDQDLGSKEEEYQEANSEYQEVLQKLEMLTKEYNAMHRERTEFEERERRLAEEKQRQGLILVRRHRAARVIQAAWRAYWGKKVAEAKKAKKAEGAKKKK